MSEEKKTKAEAQAQAPALEIRRMLVLSTAHLPEHLINGPAPDGVVRHDFEYGCLLWVPDSPRAESAENEDAPIPEEILHVQLYARKHGCDYVMFDQDGDTVGELRTWEW